MAKVSGRRASRLVIPRVYHNRRLAYPILRRC